MDDADVTVEDIEDGPGEHNHPKMLVNETPDFLIGAYQWGVMVIQSYGWFIVAAILLLIYLKKRFEPTLSAMHRRKEDQQYLNIDPETARKRQEAMEQSRRRMQEEHDAKTALAKEQQKLREEQKRKEKIEDWDKHQRGGGYRSKIKSVDEEPSSSQGQPKPKPKTTYRSDDYNPLTGTSSGATFRPPRRSGNTGG